MMRRINRAVPYYVFPNLMVWPSVWHAIFTRQGGVSRPPLDSLNVGNSVGDSETAVQENKARIYATLGLCSEDVVTAQQVHGARVAVVTGADRGRTIPTTDGLVSDTPGIALLLRFADCVPILLFDPMRRAVGLVHAGWRGTIEGIATRAVRAVEQAFGTQPADLRAALGPAIGPCCYEVGEDVAEAVQCSPFNEDTLLRPGASGRWYFDLPEANRQQLLAVGVCHIEQANMCTVCHRHEFFSHRGDGATTGRFAVLIGLKADASIEKGAPLPL